MAIEINGEWVTAQRVINCAGLNSRKLAGRSPYAYGKGSYFRVQHSKLKDLAALIYPVTPMNNPSLGIHLTQNMYGEWYLGPDLEWVQQIDYDVHQDRRQYFLTAARLYLPWLEERHLTPGYSGIRPKTSASQWSDFDIRVLGDNAQLIHCLGIESPGLTAALALAEHLGNTIVPR